MRHFVNFLCSICIFHAVFPNSACHEISRACARLVDVLPKAFVRAVHLAQTGKDLNRTFLVVFCQKLPPFLHERLRLLPRGVNIIICQRGELLQKPVHLRIDLFLPLR